MTKLTDIAIRKLPVPETGRKTYWEQGFGVRVSYSGSKAFVLKHQGKMQVIGKYPAMSLKIARETAQRMKLGDTPQTRLESLSEARTAYLAECEVKNRPATVKQYRHFLMQVTKPKLSDVSRNDIDMTSPHAVMAWRVFFNWCIRNELIDKNPFNHTKVSWTSRSRVLTAEELKAVYTYDHPPYSDYVKLMVLTGQRVGQFKQFVLKDDTVLFPASIMKGKIEHEIPLTNASRPIFERLQPFNGWSKAKTRLDKTTGITDWVQHDLRRTFSTRMAALRVPIHVTEALLAHSSGQVSGVAATYNRYNYLIEMREALEAYELWLDSIVCS